MTPSRNRALQTSTAAGIRPRVLPEARKYSVGWTIYSIEAEIGQAK